MLKTINPAYIILKPSLVGGLKKSEDWINIAANNNVKWWATSALESNIGLNAISQWVYGKSTNMKQGLGTGKLFSNNILSPYTPFHEQRKLRPVAGPEGRGRHAGSLPAGKHDREAVDL